MLVARTVPCYWLKLYYAIGSYCTMIVARIPRYCDTYCHLYCEQDWHIADSVFELSVLFATDDIAQLVEYDPFQTEKMKKKEQNRKDYENWSLVEVICEIKLQENLSLQKSKYKKIIENCVYYHQRRLCI